jgi:oligosaccharide reducing-end xylanase
MPDYAGFDGSPIDPGGRGHDAFRFDAWRVGMNVAVDHAWFAADAWQIEQSNRLLGFFAREGIDSYVNQYALDGRPLSKDRSLGLVATNAVAALAATTDERRAFVEALWDAAPPAGRWRYYDGLLYMMGLLHVSGEFRIYAPPRR